MRGALKKITALLPEGVQQELKRHYFGVQIRRGSFRPDEPEFERLSGLVALGDWVVDVGANIGQYAVRLSDLVGPEGRVFALEPVPATFELLAANCARCRHRNVTLLNVAASSAVGLVGMEIPEWEPGGRSNYYRARVTDAPPTRNQCAVLAVPLDALELPRRVTLVKIDTEGHELEVVRGMTKLIRRDHPTIIAEETRANAFLEGCGYQVERLPGSPNSILTVATAAGRLARP